MLTGKAFHPKYLNPFFNSILILLLPSKSMGICFRSFLASVISRRKGWRYEKWMESELACGRLCNYSLCFSENICSVSTFAKSTCCSLRVIKKCMLLCCVWGLSWILRFTDSQVLQRSQVLLVAFGQKTKKQNEKRGCGSLPGAGKTPVLPLGERTAHNLESEEMWFMPGDHKLYGV